MWYDLVHVGIFTSVMVGIFVSGSGWRVEVYVYVYCVV